MRPDSPSPLALFHPATRAWFEASFPAPTLAQAEGWPAIVRGDSTLIQAPTGSGKTLTAFLACLDRLIFSPPPAAPRARCRVLYLSPLKALAVDVERNLRTPLEGVLSVARARGEPCHEPSVWVRSGDTPTQERARFARTPADILITTPESLYLLLTSQAREALRSVETVIVDEIHALVPNKRGAHLALSLERLEALVQRPLQRIGLSATVRPLDEVARFLSGAVPQQVDGPGAAPRSSPGPYRPVTQVKAAEPKALGLRLELPIEAPGASVWTAIHPRLLSLIRTHRSTLVFVNSRRLAERLAAALNELAQETLVHAHHGALARAQRTDIEARLKAGTVRGLVATSSLELGIDMGAVDLVVQIEAPPSVASGLQRIGRAEHRVGARSHGVLIPKHRADLLACAALVEAMEDGRVEAIRCLKNPLDVLAQQLVAMVSVERWTAQALFACVRAAAPFAELGWSTFEGVLDLLSGRYASADFSDLRPRLTWDRATGAVTAREGAHRVAVANGGTIPDRGLYGVFLAKSEGRPTRVGELDEEMVFESKVGETFLLGASTWRIEDITFDRVLVSPAPGEPGKMPFWRGDAAERSPELGRAMGQMVRELGSLSRPAALERLCQHHHLDVPAAESLLRFLDEQRRAIGAVPDDVTVVVERCRDELGDWRLCVLTPWGGKVHAPWALAATAKLRQHTMLEAETLWTNDGFVLRLPESESPPDSQWLFPTPEELEPLLVAELSSSTLFAAKFREAASRALLLPRRRPGGRTPLWKQRKRSHDLLSVASKFPDFPVLLETYRECLQDVFDLPTLLQLFRDVQAHTVRVVTVDSRTPSPFAASLLFGYVGNFLYEGDVPRAERRAQALSIDHNQLKELWGDLELRALLDDEALSRVEEELQRRTAESKVRSEDGVHDVLLRQGDLSAAELSHRHVDVVALASQLESLRAAGRIVALPVGGELRFVAVEHVALYRDALGLSLPPGLPAALLAPVSNAREDLILRFARARGPFTTDALARRWALSTYAAEQGLRQLAARGQLLEGAFRPHGAQREWCAPDVLGAIRRRSLAKLRKEVEPVEPAALARLFVVWQGLKRRRTGLDALLDAVERLQGTLLIASSFEEGVLASRLEDYSPDALDRLAAAGEVVWCGLGTLGERDGRIALFLTEQLGRLHRFPRVEEASLSDLERRLVAHLRSEGASFFPAVHTAAGQGVEETLEALWSLVWRGVVTNDTFRALRARTQSPSGLAPSSPASGHGTGFRSRRASPPSAEGRWSLLESRWGERPSDTAWSAALTQQLLARYGVVTREMPSAEGIPGGFSAVYDVLRAMEEGGRVRRGYFVSGVGALQFALPSVVELLRTLKDAPSHPEAVLMAAVDPANPYGAVLSWPPSPDGTPRPLARAAGAWVVLVNGELSAYLSRSGHQLWTFFPDAPSVRESFARGVAQRLAELCARPSFKWLGLLLTEVDGRPAAQSPLAPVLQAYGFRENAQGLFLRMGSGPSSLGGLGPH